MFEQAFKNTDDIMWKEADCSSNLNYTEKTSWLLFLKCLDDLEVTKAVEAELPRQVLRTHHCQKQATFL